MQPADAGAGDRHVGGGRGAGQGPVTSTSTITINSTITITTTVTRTITITITITITTLHYTALLLEDPNPLCTLPTASVPHDDCSQTVGVWLKLEQRKSPRESGILAW